MNYILASKKFEVKSRIKSGKVVYTKEIKKYIQKVKKGIKKKCIICSLCSWTCRDCTDDFKVMDKFAGKL